MPQTITPKTDARALLGKTVHSDRWPPLENVYKAEHDKNGIWTYAYIGGQPSMQLLPYGDEVEVV